MSLRTPINLLAKLPSVVLICWLLFCCKCWYHVNVGGAFGGNRGARPVPPEKGVFPLDHLHLCDLEKKEYISCLKPSGHKSDNCRRFSKQYLECRMQKNLMAKQDMSELGFGKEYNPDVSEVGDHKMKTYDIKSYKD